MPAPREPTDPADRTGDAASDRTFGGDSFAAPGELPQVPGYDVLGELGLGGMGGVYRARDRRLRRELAVKVLLPRHVSNPELRRRFVEEAQICGQLQHPGVVPVHEVGTLPDGRPFFAMKLVKGRTLAELLRERPDSTTNRPQLLEVFEQVCRTLAYAHDRGVVHRDLKPANVMVGAFGEVQVMDWGLAKVLPEASEGLSPLASRVQTLRTDNPLLERTRMGSLVGTYSYMAPEQALGRVDQIDRRTDVFGLGALLCATLTGLPPYTGPAAETVLAQAARAEQTAARQRLAECGADPDLVQLAQDCLEPERDARPANAAVVAERVARYREGVAERLQRTELERVTAVARAAAERKRRRLFVAFGAVVLAVVLAGGAAAWWLADRREQAERAVSAALAQAEAHLNAGEWEAARAAADQAAALADGGFVGGNFRTAAGIQASHLHVQADALDQAAADDRRLVSDLADARAAAGPFEGQPDAVADVFRAHGLDPDAAPPEQAAGFITARPTEVARTLVAALDDLAVRRQRRGRPEPEWRRLLTAADRADPDPQRVFLRGLLGRTPSMEELARLRDLAKPDAVSAAPPPTVLLLGRLLARAGQAAEAEGVLRTGLNRHPADAWLNHELGMFYLDAAPPRAAEAVRYLLVARAVRPEFGVSLAFAWVKLNDPAEAEAVLAELVRQRPDAPQYRAYLGLALVLRKKPAEAEAEFRQALTAKPDLAVAHAGLGAALVGLKKPAEAEAELRESLRLNPSLTAARRELAQLLLDREDYPAAEAELREAVRLRPEDADLQNLFGIALRRQGKTAEAEAEFRAAIRADPSFYSPRFNLGLVLTDRQQYAEAVAAYREAIRLKGDDPSAHHNLALALRELGRYEEARSALARGLELLKPGDSRRTDYQQSLSHYERLAALAPRLPRLVSGDYQPKDAAESITAAELCWMGPKKYYRAAVRFYRSAFEDAPELADDRAQRHRYNAACAAVMTAAGAGEDAGELGATARARYRKSALAWLRDELTAWGKLRDDPQRRPEIARTLKHWRGDTDLASVRGPDALAKLPEEERDGWQKLWADADRLLQAVTK